MDRSWILDRLERYRQLWASELACVERVERLVRGFADCAERTCFPGHLTGSAWVFDATGTQFLLTHHRKLNRWLQLGGHADGELDPPAVARREVLEESGLTEVAWLDPDGLGVPVDIDVHEIPARPNEPAHWHHDLRYVFQAPVGGEVSADLLESHAVQWFPVRDLHRIVSEPSILRLAAKAQAILERMSPGRD